MTITTAIPSTLPALPALPGVSSSASGSSASGVSADSGGFFGMLQNALQSTSGAQSAAQGEEQAVAAGAPGASTAKALVLSDRAEIDWSALVATRNEAVSAYQTIMNMQI